MTERKHRVTTVVSTPTMEALEKKANEERRKLSFLVNMILEEYFDTYKDNSQKTKKP